MNAKKILCATDFSSASEEALRYAEALARDTGAKLLIVHVEEPPLPYGTGELFLGTSAEMTPLVEETLEGVKPSDPAIEYEHRMLMGDAASEIVRLATEEEVDMIVVGSHGRTGLGRMLMGSVAEVVVRRATCPVIAIKTNNKKPAMTGA